MNSGENHEPHQWCLDCSPLETIRKSTSDPKSFPVSPLFISRGSNFHGRGAGWERHSVCTSGMHEEINSGQPRADFPRKISKENTRNNFCLTIWVKENWNLIRNLWKETKVGKRRTRELELNCRTNDERTDRTSWRTSTEGELNGKRTRMKNTKLIQVRVSCWFANLFWALPQKLYAFKLLWLTNSCDTTWA